MKKCSRCGQGREEHMFDAKKGGGTRGHCVECRKAYVNDHYARNKESYKARAVLSKRRARDRYTEYKRSLSCAVCGMSFCDEPFLCDLHHAGGDKDFNPSTMADRSTRAFMAEASKCVPLCANCHRRAHYAP